MNDKNKEPLTTGATTSDVVNWLKQINNLVKSLSTTVSSCQSLLKDAVNWLKQINALVKSLAAVKGVAKETLEIEYITYNYNLPSLVGVRMYEVAPFKGTVKEAVLHWPSGCNGLVGIAVWHGGVQFFPTSGYLTLNDVTPSFVFNEAVNDRENIWVDMYNSDGLNPHNITVIVRVERVISEAK